MTVGTALREGIRLLESGGVPEPRLTAEVLLSHALHRNREFLYAHPEEELEDVPRIHYGRYLYERLSGKPTQYITRRQEFFGREFRVTPAVLIPRPETEHLVERAMQFRWSAALDVGCGSGAIAVTLSLERGLPVVAADISPEALAVASENARRFGADVRFVCADVLDAFAAGSFDLVVSNPPYVPNAEAESMQREVRDFEPHVALFSGETGFEIYERIVAGARRVLKPGGTLAMELGFRSQSRVVEMLAGWREIDVTPDLAGIPRVVTAAL
jgi:release factor glutamine methyltransferase